jgi:hypothetical protein
MNYMSNVVRSAGDPKIISTGPSSLAAVDRLARALGWFSVGLGAAELLMPRLLARALGIRGRERLLRAYGAREVAAGLLTLSPDKQVGLWSRVVGDGLDIVTLLAAARRPGNPKRGNVGFALAMVIGITMLDVVAAQALAERHGRKRDGVRRYSDRSGFPNGVQSARGAARNFERPKDMRAAPALASELGRRFEPRGLH